MFFSLVWVTEMWARLFETFEDRKQIFLVMELCKGGELFDRIIEAGDGPANLCLRKTVRPLAFSDHFDSTWFPLVLVCFQSFISEAHLMQLYSKEM